MPSKPIPEIAEIKYNPKKIKEADRVGMIETEHAVGIVFMRGKDGIVYPLDYEELLHFHNILTGQLARLTGDPKKIKEE